MTWNFCEDCGADVLRVRTVRLGLLKLDVCPLCAPRYQRERVT